MESTPRVFDRIAGVILALALTVIGLGFMVLGVSLLPVIGILVGISVIDLALHFLNPKATEHIKKTPLLCPWPQMSAAVGPAA